MQATRLCLALMACTGVSTLASASEGELIRRWEFSTPADAAGWTVGHDAEDLQVIDGRLQLTTIGPDAYIFAPPLDAPLDGCVVRVQMGGTSSGVSEVFWSTKDAPGYSPRRRAFLDVPLTSPAASQPADTRLYEFVIGTPQDKGRTLNGFRIDPLNGRSGSRVWIDWVELRRLPPVLDLVVSTAVHKTEAGRPVPLHIAIRPIAGRAVEGTAAVGLPDGTRTLARLGKAEPMTQAEVAAGRPGVNRLRTTAALEGDGPAYDFESSVIASTSGDFPILAVMSSDQVRLEFIASADGQGVSAARWSVATGPDRWRLAGWLLPLAQVVCQDDQGRVERREPALSITKKLSDTVRLEGFVDDRKQLRTTLLFTIRSALRPHQVAVTCSLENTGPARLLDFSGPVVLIDRESPGDPLERYALFGGIEFLEPGWASSSDRAVGDRFAERWSPSPYKITLPVMGVEAQGLTTGIMWMPQAGSVVADCRPWPTFASPNLVNGQANHLMKLSLPASTALRHENESYARQPVVLTQPGLVGMWQYILHAEPDLPVAMMARRWYEAFGAPPAAGLPHDSDTLYDLIARNFGETMWWPEEKGWRRHWYHTETGSTYAADMAAELIAHSLLTEQNQHVERTGLQGRSILEAAAPLSARLMNDGHARAMIASMRADGTWAFRNSPEMREQTRRFTDGKHDSLGEDGSTSLGTCVQAALPVLRHALLSGEPGSIDAGVRALEAMRQFRVPRGAQVWEVHQQIPDIRAAALAVEACVAGYQLTGEARFLDDAQYWAWTGVPFVYSWAVPTDRMEGRMIASRDRDDLQRIPLTLAEGFENPRRQIMPYATVPVLGPTFYVVNWFGVVVQWCGLEWAQHVIELDAWRPDPLLRRIADGVVASGLQQMFDKPPWTGLYPDVWDVPTNTAQGALIYAGLPLRCLVAQGLAPAWTSTWSRVIRGPEGRSRWHVSGWGAAPALPPPSADEWSAGFTYLPGQPCEVLLAGMPAPREVLIDGRTLKPAAPGTRALLTDGWRYMEGPKAVTVVFTTPPAGRAEVRIRW